MVMPYLLFVARDSVVFGKSSLSCHLQTDAFSSSVPPSFLELVCMWDDDGDAHANNMFMSVADILRRASAGRGRRFPHSCSLKY